MRPTLDNLQGLRGLACLAVVLYHLHQWEARLGLGAPLFTAVKRFGYAGVDLFFVISGFIIAHATHARLGRPRELGPYLFRRFWRLYPPYWFALGFSTLVTVGVYGHHVGQLDWAGNAATWFGLWPGPHLFLPHAWTLTFEALFYVAFGALFLLPVRAGVGLLVAWAAGLLGVAVAGWQSENPIVSLATTPYVLEFLAGVFTSSVVRRGWTGAERPALALALAWLLVGSLALNHRDAEALMNAPRPRVLVFGPPAALIVYALTAAERRQRWRLPAWSRTLGDASYSIYLTHLPIGYAMMLWTIGWPHKRLPHVGWSITMLTACLGGGWLMYRIVERPLMALSKRPREPVPKGHRIAWPRRAVQAVAAIIRPRQMFRLPNQPNP